MSEQSGKNSLVSEGGWIAYLDSLSPEEREQAQAAYAEEGQLRRGTPQWSLLLTVRRALLMVLGALEKYLGIRRTKPPKA